MKHRFPDNSKSDIMRRGYAVSIGPVFEISTTAMSQLPEAAAMKGIRLVRLEDSKQHEFRDFYMFSAHVGRICCKSRDLGETSRLWLVFPRSHAFNPLAWPFNFYLSRRIQRTLEDLGARRVEWESLDTNGN